MATGQLLEVQLTRDENGHLRIHVDANNKVTFVEPGCNHQPHLKAGDLVIKVDGQPLLGRRLKHKLADLGPQPKHLVTVLRNFQDELLIHKESSSQDDLLITNARSMSLETPRTLQDVENLCARLVNEIEQDIHGENDIRPKLQLQVKNFAASVAAAAVAAAAKCSGTLTQGVAEQRFEDAMSKIEQRAEDRYASIICFVYVKVCGNGISHFSSPDAGGSLSYMRMKLQSHSESRKTPSAFTKPSWPCYQQRPNLKHS